MKAITLATVLCLALAGTATSALAADASLAGRWLIRILSPQGTLTPSMVLTQDGTKLTGTYKGMRGEAPIAGTLNGNTFDLTVKIVGAESTLVVEYKGQVSGDALSGRVLMGPMGEANFTGQRAP